MDRPCKTCMSQTCPGFGNPGACAGTLETEAHPDRVTEKQFEDIIAYQLECFHESKAGLPFNERYLLSMIIELREHRELEKKNAMRPIAPPITFTTPKTEITAADIPRGMSAEDVALPEHSCDNCLDTDPDNCIYNICEQERREQEAADTLKVNWEMTARHRGKIAQQWKERAEKAEAEVKLLLEQRLLPPEAIPTCSKCDEDLEYLESNGYWHCVTKSCDGVIASGPAPRSSPNQRPHTSHVVTIPIKIESPPGVQRREVTRVEAACKNANRRGPCDCYVCIPKTKPTREEVLEWAKQGEPIPEDGVLAAVPMKTNRDMPDGSGAQAYFEEYDKSGGFAAAIRDHINSGSRFKHSKPCCRGGSVNGHDSLCSDKKSVGQQIIAKNEPLKKIDRFMESRMRCNERQLDAQWKLLSEEERSEVVRRIEKVPSENKINEDLVRDRIDPPKDSSFEEALVRACKEDTLIKALSWIALWESERVVKQAKTFFETGTRTGSHGGGWDTCFEYCFNAVNERYVERNWVIRLDHWYLRPNEESGSKWGFKDTARLMTKEEAKIIYWEYAPKITVETFRIEQLPKFNPFERGDPRTTTVSKEDVNTLTGKTVYVDDGGPIDRYFDRLEILMSGFKASIREALDEVVSSPKKETDDEF